MLLTFLQGHAYRVAIGVSQYYEDIQRDLGAKAVSLALASLTANADDKEQKVRAARLLLNLAFVGAFEGVIHSEMCTATDVSCRGERASVCA